MKTITEPGPFDREELLSRCVGSVEFAEHLLQIFTTRFCEDLERLEQRLEAGDADELARIAHTMKGAAGNVAAPGLHQRTARIEELARQRRLAEISGPIARLRDEWERFSEAVAAGGFSPETLNQS
jgi:HPt (histidine-containing phosphotransfer) domain-containing protein